MLIEKIPEKYFGLFLFEFLDIYSLKLYLIMLFVKKRLYLPY